ncbi:TlpA disulfide reductase family protein [Porphyromonadaceae bacterium W3.11]|nr:TlpA disulfide reductase family protein [Porphyromonadaceae bacterium W3.11]
MKKFIYFYSVFLLIPIFVVSCNKSSQIESEGIQINGVVNNIESDSLYLYDVYSEHYGYLTPLASFPLDENKQFTYSNDTIRSKLYFISTNGQQIPGLLDQNGSYIFLTNGRNEIVLTQIEPGVITGEVTNSLIDAQYRAYKEKAYTLGNRHVLDSLDAEFYAARDKGDTTEMARIKEESGPYYDEAMANMDEWIKSQLNDNKYELFDLYLYYSKVFQITTYNSIEDISAVREELKKYNEEAQASAYRVLIEESLKLQEKSAIGIEAPDVIGENPEGESIHLNDYRGKYVLMDFWGSGCTWCRAENPYLSKTYNKFKENDFTILGISTDVDKDAWLNAIKEDHATWDHIILDKEHKSKILSEYNIIGIPQIILIDKEGKILAKGLRGDDIYETVAEYVSE